MTFQPGKWNALGREKERAAQYTECLPGIPNGQAGDAEAWWGGERGSAINLQRETDAYVSYKSQRR